MKLSINPDSETVRCGANHACRTLFRLTLRLMFFQAPALCRRDLLLLVNSGAAFVTPPRRPQRAFEE
jgi:hypothetical protein